MAAAGKLMTTRKEPRAGTLNVEPTQTEATKEELQHRMETARESISETVEQIRDTVESQYESVKAGVNGVLDWRAGFQNEPLLWGVGALCAGFAFGYTFGVAEKSGSRRGRRSSALATFAEGVVAELEKAGDRSPLLSLNPQLRAAFGFDLSELLAEIGGAKKPRRKSSSPKRKRRPRRQA